MNAEHVRAVALQMASEKGLVNLSRTDLCQRAGIPAGSFPNVMGCSFTEFVESIRDEANQSATRSSKRRTAPELRRRQILEAAVKTANDHGFERMTRERIAETAGVTPGLVSKYFETMAQLRNLVIRRAIEDETIPVLAAGIAAGVPTARKAPAKLKRRAAEYLATA